MTATELEITESLRKAYDSVEYKGNHVWECYLQFTDKIHTVTLENDGQVWVNTGKQKYVLGNI
jgi:hypothetical protein